MNRYWMNLIDSIHTLYNRFYRDSLYEGDNDMVSWKKVDPKLLENIPKYKLTRVKAAIKEEVREEVMRELQTDSIEVERERGMLKKFAKEVEISAQAHSIVLDGIVAKRKSLTHKKSMATLWIIPFQILAGVILNLTAGLAFPSIPFPVIAGSNALILVVLGFLALSLISRAYDSAIDDTGTSSSEDDANRYKALAAQAREERVVKADKARTLKELKDAFEELDDWKSRLDNDVNLPMTELIPTQERVRIQLTADDDDFEERLREAQEEAEAEAEEEAKTSSNRA